jgi:hypothetical protein
MFGRLGCMSFQCARIVILWATKFIRTRFQKCKKCCARKKLDQAQARLGAEIFSLYKNEQTDWPNAALVPQYLKAIEAAELEVFQLDDALDRINADYLKKKQEIREKCPTSKE